MKVQAADNEEKLYMEFLEKMTKEGREEYESWSSKYGKDSGFSYIPGDYRIIDINQDGKKELLTAGWSDGAAKTGGGIYSIQDGKVQRLIVFTGPGYYKIKGAQKKIAVFEAIGATDSCYTVYQLSAGRLVKKDEYGMHGDPTVGYTKNGEKISKKIYQNFTGKLKEIKLNQDIYMDYLKQMEKKIRKKIPKSQSDSYSPDTILIWYEMIDLDYDGNKELLFTSNDPEWLYMSSYGWICTISNGKVQKLLKLKNHVIDFYQLSGSEKRIVVVSSGLARASEYTVYKVSSGKLKKEQEYMEIPVIPPRFGYIFMKDGKEIPNPFGNKLKEIRLKPFQSSYL